VVEELTEIERLDLVARAAANKLAIFRARWPLTIVCLFAVFIASSSAASARETAAVRIATILTAATAAMVWLNSRYAAYALAIFCFVVAIGVWFFQSADDRTLLGSTANVVGSAIVFFIGYGWWTNAAAIAAAQSDNLATERAQVSEWLRVLRSAKLTGQVIEFSSKSFVRGYWTYRLMNTGFYWVTTKFKTGHMNRLSSCRVVELDAVHVTDPPGGKLRILIGDQAIQEVEISPEMRGRLLNSVNGRKRSETDRLLPGSAG
jgi:hypothetical protein